MFKTCRIIILVTMSTREVRYDVVAGVGYSFLVSVLTLALEALANIFYPTPLVLSPIWAIYKGIYIRGYWVSFFLILALYGLLIIFVKPYRSEELMGYMGIFRATQRVVIFTIIALAILSIVFDAYTGPLRTRIGLFIVVNVIAGVVGGYLGSKFYFARK